MASRGSANERQQGLRQAASVLFALMGIMPALVFAFTLWQLGAIHHTLAQASLGLTLVLTLLGYSLFRSMLAQMSEVVKGVSRAVQTVVRPAGSLVTAAGTVPTPADREVAGLGSIWELDEMAHTMDLLWQREARAHVGRRVQITVANSQDVAGKLLEATEDGVLLEQAGGATVAITYRRVQGIEPLAGA
jgi:hypothetical protein